MGAVAVVTSCVLLLIVVPAAICDGLSGVDDGVAVVAAGTFGLIFEILNGLD